MSHKKIGPDRFSRFDVYWTQTDKQTDRQDKFIYRLYVYIYTFTYILHTYYIYNQFCLTPHSYNHQKSSVGFAGLKQTRKRQVKKVPNPHSCRCR